MRHSEKSGRFLKQIYPSPRSTKAEVAWLAAMIEGEGCIGWNTTKRGHRVPVVQISMVDRDVIERIARLFGTPARGPYGPYGSGSIRRQPHHRAHAYGRAAVRVLKMCLPWFGERRTAKAQEVLAWQYHRVTNNPKTGRLEVA